MKKIKLDSYNDDYQTANEKFNLINKGKAELSSPFKLYDYDLELLENIEFIFPEDSIYSEDEYNSLTENELIIKLLTKIAKKYNFIFNEKQLTLTIPKGTSVELEDPNSGYGLNFLFNGCKVNLVSFEVSVNVY